MVDGTFDNVYTNNLYPLSGSTTININNLLSLPTQGSSGGLLIGGDANLYRSGSNILKTTSDLTCESADIIVSHNSSNFYTSLLSRTSSNYASMIFRRDGVRHAGIRWNGTYLEFLNASPSAGNPDLWTTTPLLSLDILNNKLIIGSDTNLYRSAPNMLKTDDSLIVSGGLVAQILPSGNVNSKASLGSYDNYLAYADKRFTIIASQPFTSGDISNLFGSSPELSARWTADDPQIIEIDFPSDVHYWSSVGINFIYDRIATNVMIEYYSSQDSLWHTIYDVDNNTSNRIYAPFTTNWVTKLRLTMSGKNAGQSEIAVQKIWGINYHYRGGHWVDKGGDTLYGNFNSYGSICGRHADSPSYWAFLTRLDSESNPRMVIDTGGHIRWNDPTGTNFDTNLYRSAPNTLKTDDSLEVAGNLTVNGTPVLTSGSTVSLSGLSVDGSVSFLGGLASASFSINQGTVTTIANSLDDGTGNASWGGYHSFKDTGLVLNVHRKGIDEGPWKNEELTPAYSYNWGQTYPASDYAPLPCLWVTKVSPQDRSSAYREQGNQQFFMDPMLSTNYAFFVEKDFESFGHIATSSDPQKQSGGGAIMMGQGWLGEGCPPIFSLTGTEILPSDADAQRLYPGASGTVLPTPTGNRAKYYRTDNQILYQDTPLYNSDDIKESERWQPLGTAGTIGGYPQHVTDPAPESNPVHWSFYYNTTTNAIRQYQFYNSTWQWRDVYKNVRSSAYDTLFLVRADTSSPANIYLNKVQCDEIYNAQNDWVEINTKLNLNGNFQLNGNVATSLNPLTSGLALGSPDEYWLGVVSASFNPRDATRQTAPFTGKIKFNGTNSTIVFRNETDTGYITLDPHCYSSSVGAHTHPRSDITNFWSTPFWNNIPDKPSSFPSEQHYHPASEINSGILATGLIPTITTGMTNFANQSLNTNSAVTFTDVTMTGSTTVSTSIVCHGNIDVSHLRADGGNNIYCYNNLIPNGGSYVGNSGDHWTYVYSTYFRAGTNGYGFYDEYDDLEIVKQWGEKNPQISDNYAKDKIRPPENDLFAILKPVNKETGEVEHDFFDASSLTSFALGCTKALAKKQDEHSAILLQLLNDKEALEAKCQLLQEQIEKLKTTATEVNKND